MSKQHLQANQDHADAIIEWIKLRKQVMRRWRQIADAQEK